MKKVVFFLAFLFSTALSFAASWTVTAVNEGENPSRTYSLDERNWTVRVYENSSGWNVSDEDSLFEYMASVLYGYEFTERHYYAEKVYGSTEEIETVLYFLEEVFGSSVCEGKDFFASSINEYIEEDGSGVVIMEWQYAASGSVPVTYIIFVPVEGVL